eukprot:scaffold16140_cov104-Isochrysis_galbana.AAC.3
MGCGACHAEGPPSRPQAGPVWWKAECMPPTPASPLQPMPPPACIPHPKGWAHWECEPPPRRGEPAQQWPVCPAPGWGPPVWCPVCVPLASQPAVP